MSCFPTNVWMLPKTLNITVVGMSPADKQLSNSLSPTLQSVMLSDKVLYRFT